jgi:hypothetical protein
MNDERVCTQPGIASLSSLRHSSFAFGTTLSRRRVKWLGALLRIALTGSLDSTVALSFWRSHSFAGHSN